MPVYVNNMQKVSFGLQSMHTDLIHCAQYLWRLIMTQAKHEAGFNCL